VLLQAFEARHIRNRQAIRSRPYGSEERAVLSREAFDEARAEISSWPGYAPTPLVALPGLAAHLGIRNLAYKDESRRFGLKSFKALGGAYAVLRLLQDHVRRHDGLDVSARELMSGDGRRLVRDLTVTAATDGNHGRSVAWGAQMLGCRSVIYIHEHVSARREREIASFGAEIRRVPGGYDDSVRQCARDAAANGWFLVADTSAQGGAGVARLVMQGYALLADEILTQLPAGFELTHVFVQAGVGGLAAAVAAHLWERLGSIRPRIVVVEPMRADCVFRSIAAGRPTPVPGDANTFMACLAAGEVSPVAWTILRGGVDDAIALPDEAAPATMRLLAQGIEGDPPLISGESGCAATAGLIAGASDAKLRATLDLDGRSGVVVIGSEGATDPETYEAVVGRPVAAIEAAQCKWHDERTGPR
jgi:diaminopropionate ammonia-lyase